MRTITIRRNDKVKTIPVGFSWTTLLFGPAPSAIRGHWPFAIAIGFSFFAVFLFMLRTLNVSVGVPVMILLLFSFAYFRNRLLLKYMVSDGWRVVCEYNVPTLVHDSEEV